MQTIAMLFIDALSIDAPSRVARLKFRASASRAPPKYYCKAFGWCRRPRSLSVCAALLEFVFFIPISFLLDTDCYTVLSQRLINIQYSFNRPSLDL